MRNNFSLNHPTSPKNDPAKKQTIGTNKLSENTISLVQSLHVCRSVKSCVLCDIEIDGQFATNKNVLVYVHVLQCLSNLSNLNCWQFSQISDWKMLLFFPSLKSALKILWKWIIRKALSETHPSVNTCIWCVTKRFSLFRLLSLSFA